MARVQSQTASPDLAPLATIIQAASDDKSLFQAIVNAPFSDPLLAAKLFLGIVVFLLVNKKDGTIDRVALSQTELAEYTKKMSVKRFEDIRIPLDDPKNILAKAIRTGKPQETTDWQYLFTPELTAEEARLNQAGGGIAYSAVYPLVGARDGGAMIFSWFSRNFPYTTISTKIRSAMLITFLCEPTLIW